MYGIVTMRNIEQFIGKTVDRQRRMFHHYPLSFQKIDDAYYYTDKNGVVMPFNKDTEIIFDRIINAPMNEPVDTGAQRTESNNEKSEEHKVSDNIHSPDSKEIRFINSDYKELFKIPDGGGVVITHPNGEQYVLVCKFLDEKHFEVNGACYNAYQFAKMSKQHGSKVEPEKEPEIVGGRYRVVQRIPVGDKIYVMGHNPKAVAPFATWQAYRDVPGYDFGHYYSNRMDAVIDLRCRADAERTGKPYDHTKAYKQPKKRDDAR